MWVEFVVGFRLASRVFLPPQKLTSPNYNSTRIEKRIKPAKTNVASSIDIANLFIYFFTFLFNYQSMTEVEYLS